MTLHVVQVYQDAKKDVKHGWGKMARYTNNKKLVKLINLLRTTEAASMKTIAFQTDSLFTPLALKLIGNQDCRREKILSWAKTEKMLQGRDAKFCLETGVRAGNMITARDSVMSSRNDIVAKFQSTICRAFT